MSKKEEEVYRITLKGLIWRIVQDNELSNDIVDSIELYMRRHYAKDGHPGIVLNLDTNNFEFVTLKHSEDE